MDSGERLIYIKDKKSGEFYSANRNYTNLPFEKYECEVGLGYHKITSVYDGVKTEFTILVPSDGYIMLYSINITNLTEQEKDLSVYFCNRPCPNLTWHTSYGSGDYSTDLDGLFYPHFGYALSHDYVCLFLKSNIKATAFDVSKNSFVGVYNDFSSPQGIKGGKLSCKGSTFEDNYVGGLQFDIKLQPKEEKVIELVFGTAKSLDECIALANQYLSQGINSYLDEQKKINDGYLDTFICQTSDEYLDTLANVWLKRQLSLGKTWGRICGKGFRDVMQDITAFVSLDHDLARKRILDALRHQYEDGNPIRMYEPDFKYPYNDGAVWIPSAVLSYLKESGDFSLLSENVPYLLGDSYSCSNSGETYSSGKYASGKTGTVLEHIDAGINYLLSCRGKRGLVLFRGGDWNDSLNNAGNLGKGESVWLSIALVKAINEYIEILQKIGKDYKILIEKRNALIDNIKLYGKKDGYYIYGYNDYDEPIGTKICEEAKIFLNPQSFAVLSGIESYNDSVKLLEIAESELICEFGYRQCAPSFTKGTDKIGRMSYFMPGMVENGSVYNHGVTFMIAAQCLLGRGNKAYDAFKLIRYDNPQNANSGVEPYAVSNMYIGPENIYRAGDAPMSWVTGSAGWLYRDLTEFILGIKAEFDGLKIAPCLPENFDKVSIKRIFRNKCYKIDIMRSNNHKGLYVNDEKMKDNIIPLKVCACAKVKYYL